MCVLGVFGVGQQETEETLKGAYAGIHVALKLNKRKARGLARNPDILEPVDHACMHGLAVSIHSDSVTRNQTKPPQSTKWPHLPNLENSSSSSRLSASSGRFPTYTRILRERERERQSERQQMREEDSERRLW